MPRQFSAPSKITPEQRLAMLIILWIVHMRETVTFPSQSLHLVHFVCRLVLFQVYCTRTFGYVAREPSFTFDRGLVTRTITMRAISGFIYSFWRFRTNTHVGFPYNTLFDRHPHARRFVIKQIAVQIYNDNQQKFIMLWFTRQWRSCAVPHCRRVLCVVFFINMQI